MCELTTLAVGEEDVRTTLATGEEEPVTGLTTFAIGEEEVPPTTLPPGEEIVTTQAEGEEGPDLSGASAAADPFGRF
jgi:hypothetical protein